MLHAEDLARILADRKLTTEALAAAGVDLAIAQRNLSAAQTKLARRSRIMPRRSAASASACRWRRLQHPCLRALLSWGCRHVGDSFCQTARMPPVGMPLHGVQQACAAANS